MPEPAVKTSDRETLLSERDAIPPGWTSNPSELSRRFILATLAFLGFSTAVYLTLYQTGVIANVWEPFFGDGSHVILNSKVSGALYIPDASIGAALYLFDMLLALAGGRDRWRTHPWIVLLNGATAAALAAAAIVLLIIQPTAYHTYCTLCLFSAFISINIVGPTMDETLAALQHLARKYTEPTERQLEDYDREPPVGITSTWDAQGIRLRHLIGAALGLWLMAAPAVMTMDNFARINSRITGPIVFLLSMLAIWPATRWFGRLNVFAGFWLMFGTILLLSPIAVILSNIVVGVILVALAGLAGNTAALIGGGWVGILGRGSELPPERPANA